MATTYPLAGKTALITGGTKGIGAATALLLAKQGANVVVTYSSDTSAASALAATINALPPTTSDPQTTPPPRALAIKSDAGALDDLKALVKTVVDTYAQIDILVLNAGIMPMATLATTAEDTYDLVHRLNVKGPYFLTQFALPHIPANGRIIFLSTSLTAASAPPPPYLLYLSTKGAIEQIVKALNREVGPRGIRVNAVSPGPTGTELFYKGKTEAMVKAVSAGIALGRIGEPEEVARMIAVLAGPDGGWVAGQVVRVNGGMA
jgi:3-oxoacyl-[acyl-carrier protein] reductase